MTNVTCRRNNLFGAYSFRGLEHNCHAKDHGSRLACMVLELRDHILIHKQMIHIYR